MAATTGRAVVARYGSQTWTVNRKPPSTGPTTMAACQVAELRATSHGSRSGGAMSDGSALVAGAAKARATPKAKTMRKIGVADVGSVLAYHASVAPTAASPSAATAATRRRSKRSAT